MAEQIAGKYCIIQEKKGKKVILSVVPSKWVKLNQWSDGSDLLFWPHKSNNHLIKLMEQNPEITPDEDYMSIKCSLKRDGFDTFIEADKVVENMLQNFSSDSEPEVTKTSFVGKKNTTSSSLNLNNQFLRIINEEEHQHEEIEGRTNENEILFSGDISQLMLPTDLNATTIDNLKETIFAKIDEVQIKMQEQLEAVKNNIEEKFQNLYGILANINAKLDLMGSTTPKNVCENRIPQRIFKIVDTLEDAQDLEEKLKDGELQNSIIELIKTKYGVEDFKNCRTAALNLVDYFWTRNFFHESSWTGKGKNENKIRFQSFVRSIELFQECVSSCSLQGGEWTVCKNTKFLQDLINNSGSRLNRDLNQRISTARSRTCNKKTLPNSDQEISPQEEV